MVSAEWETRSTVALLCIISWILALLFSLKKASPTLNISSKIRIPGVSLAVATAKPSRDTIPEEKFLIFCSINPSSSANSTIWLYLRRINSLLYPRIAPFKYTFSLAVSSLSKPVPRVRSCILDVSATTLPLVGSSAPEMIFNNVLFPDPLVPMIPRTSPR